MKKLMILCLFTAGCAAGPPAQVAGKYQGFFGGQMSDQKIGCTGELTQKAEILTGKFHLVMQKDGSQFDLDCSADGSVKGKNINLRLHGKQAKFELIVSGEYITEGETRIVGNASLEGRDGGQPVLLKRQP
ncbi:MAG: hypothetical protein KF760_03845 [Candidatus Eremiobacteraeota bacterium]|nr:hypothetical protein [Candidatus Eremiobacteraeota bacterium]MCW5870095.1 hypothetical protein [Candidatus Eremiobacteraeota bacterium]